jgi:branched-chain amino acid transport system permease protein
MATVRSRPYPVSYSSETSLMRSGTSRAWALLLVIVAIVLPHLASQFYTTIAVTVFLTAVGAIALNLLMGNAGLVSLGAAAFLAVGGFTGASLATDTSLPFLVVLLASGAAAGIVGLIVGAFTLRLRGLYIVMATFALHFIVLFATNKYQIARSGVGGFLLPVPKIGPWTINSLTSWYYLTLIFAALATIVALNIQRTSVGRAWLAMRDRELAAQALGINVRRARVVAFGWTSFLFGIAGALGAYYIGNVTTDSYGIDLAIQYVAIIIIGGLGSALGSWLGSIFVVLLPYVVNHAINVWLAGLPFVDRLGQHTFEVQAGLYGVAIVAFMLLEPGGLATLWRNRLLGSVTTFPLRRRWPVEA